MARTPRHHRLVPLGTIGPYPQAPHGPSRLDRNRVSLTKMVVQGQTMKCWGHSKMHFPKVSCQTEPSSGGNQPFEVRHFSIFCVSVFWRFIELRASYRAQILTVERSRRPGKLLKCILGARSPNKLRKACAKVRSRSRPRPAVRPRLSIRPRCSITARKQNRNGQLPIESCC